MEEIALYKETKEGLAQLSDFYWNMLLLLSEVDTDELTNEEYKQAIEAERDLKNILNELIAIEMAVDDIRFDKNVK